MRNRTRGPVRALVAASLACCVGVVPMLAGAPAGASGPVASSKAAGTGLQAFADCDSLLAHLKEIGVEHVGPYGFGGPSYGVFDTVGDDIAGSGEVVGTGGAALPQTDAEPVFSETNNQEAGVDESDTVKTDGKRLLVLRQGVLSLIDVANPSKPVRRSQLTLQRASDNGYNGSVLLRGSRALVLLPRWRPFDDSSSTSPFGPLIAGEPVTDVVLVSLSNLAKPVVLDRVTIDGSLVAARLVGGSARLALTSEPLGLAFVTPQSAKGSAAALAANRQIIRDSTLADWLPALRRGSASSAAVGCGDVRTPTVFAGVTMTTLHTIALGSRVEPASAGLLAQSDTAYASAEHLYITSPAWVDPARYTDPRAWEELSTSYRTAVHEFDISGAKATYVASGEVRGHTLSQWSMSESAGDLRIATTDGPWWTRPVGARGPESESFMTVLSEQDGNLLQVGQVGGIGRGEQIRAVRYDGATAYVVTFRQIDPFFVLDLSKPTRPTVVGQLKVAGYSGYLHPIGGGRVLGVGADATSQGRVTGAKVALFDVSNPRKPRQLGTVVIPGSSTPVEFDAKAFLWWAPTGLAVVPTQNWGPRPFTGAIGVTVSRDSLRLSGFVSHSRPKEQGRTACRPIQGQRELGLDPSSILIDCAPGQPVSAVGYSCYSAEGEAIVEQLGTAVSVPAGHTVGICYPSGPPIVDRSAVVGTRLLTVSEHTVLSSDLRTLTPGRFTDF